MQIWNLLTERFYKAKASIDPFRSPKHPFRFHKLYVIYLEMLPRRTSYAIYDDIDYECKVAYNVDKTNYMKSSRSSVRRQVNEG